MYRKLRMKLLLVPLVLLSSVTNAQLLWSYHNRSDSVHRTDTPLLDPSMVTLSVEKSSACAYDPVRILWRSADSDRLSEVLLSVSRSSSFSDSQMLTIPILSTVTTAGAAAHPMDSNDVTEADLPLIGLLRDPSVLPAVANVLTKPDLALLIVEFAEETTTPILADTASVLNACVFTPLLRGEATGTWTDSRTLQLRVSMDYLRVLLLAHKRGELIQIKPDLEKKKTADDLLKETVFGEVIVRPTEHGILRISAVDKYTLEEVSPVADVTVSLCEKDQLLPALHGRSIVETAPELTDTVPSPTRMTNLRGPFALTGNHAIKIVEEFSTALVSIKRWYD